ncbi:hypothetical protein FRX31_016690, partial [Thalictrum thalictroides]
IDLDYPSEYITSISGYRYYVYGYGNYIFGTNQSTYLWSIWFCKQVSFILFLFNDITAIGAYLKPYVGPSTSTSTSTAALIKSEPVG